MPNVKPEVKKASEVVEVTGNQGIITLEDGLEFDLTTPDTRTEVHPIKQTRRPRYFAAIVFVRWNYDKKIFEVVLADYREDGEKTAVVQVKYPGGCSEHGETMLQCVRKEALEETGITLRKDLVLLCTRAFKYDKRLPLTMENLEHLHGFFVQEMPYYANATPFLKTKTASDEGECSNVRWVPFDESLKNLVFYSHKNVIKPLHAYLMDKKAVRSKDHFNALANMNF